MACMARRDSDGSESDIEPEGSHPSLKQVFFGFSDLVFSLDSRLWQTLLGLVFRPLRTNRRYFARGDTGLLNPLRLMVGLSTLSVVMWTLLPQLPSFMEMFEEVRPDLIQGMREDLAEQGVQWAHFADAVDNRASILNVPFVMLVAIPLMFYLKLLRRDLPLVRHALFTLNQFNVYLIFHAILSVLLFLAGLNSFVVSAIPLFGVLVPYLLYGLWHFYFPSPGRFAAASLGLLVVGVVSYVAASNIGVYIAFRWAYMSVTG